MNVHSDAHRDTLLDAIRAYTMMYIICVVHLFYYCLWPTDTLVSLILIEMPVIFFISGASARHSHKHTFRRLLVGRLRRVLLPYYVYAAISLLMLYVLGMSKEHFGVREMLTFSCVVTAQTLL